MDDHQMLKDALSKAKQQGLTPIIVLDIPREANGGGKDFPFPLFFVGVTSIMNSVSTFAKDVSSDSSLAHAPRRRFRFRFTSSTELFSFKTFPESMARVLPLKRWHYYIS